MKELKAIQILSLFFDEEKATNYMNDHSVEEVKEFMQEAITELEQLQTKHKELEAFYELVCSLVGSGNSYQDILNKLRNKQC